MKSIRELLGPSNPKDHEPWSKGMLVLGGLIIGYLFSITTFILGYYYSGALS